MSIRPEAERDQVESAFTPILRRLREAGPGVLAAVFVDGEGECIDYCSSLPSYDAKVTGAHMLVLVAEIIERFTAWGFGEPFEYLIHGDSRDFFIRRLSRHYILILICTPDGLDSSVHEGLENAVVALRREAAIDPPAWARGGDELDVVVRAAVGWAYAPVSFRLGGKRLQVQHVLGRWITDREEGGLVCFRIRTGDGRELTIAHDGARDAWRILAPDL